MQPQHTSPEVSADAFAGVDVLILCGGKGTRLQSVVSDRPKVLAEVGGKPFLDRLIDTLSTKGFRRVILSVGYLRDQIKDRYAGREGIFFAEEETPLGTGGGLKNAEALVASDDLLVMNGDSYIDGGADLAAFYRFHKEHNAQVTLMLAKPRAEKDYGVVSLAADQKILRFNEKTDEPGEHFLSAGMYFMKKDAFATMPAGAFSLETEFFPKLVGGSFYGFPIEGSVVDIGTPERYRVAQEIFFN